MQAANKKKCLSNYVLTIVILVNESDGSSSIFPKPSGSIIFASISNPVIVLGPGLLKYAFALTA
jgi:hypothetical protein